MKHALVALVALLLAPPAATNAAEVTRPNIILFLCDDLGWSDIGCYGGEIPTPNIDALAAGGLRFTQFYNNAVCGPSRAALLTGLYPQQIGHSGKHWNEPTNFSKSVSLGELLKTAGYRTLLVGKWQERDLPAQRGFDRFFGTQCAGKISYFNEVQLDPFYLDTKRWKAPAEGFYLTDALTDYAVKLVEEALAKPTCGGPPAPFFLYLAHVAPHWPLRSTKLTAYEGGIRTPLIVSWPAVIREGGRITGEVGHVMDFMPTVADVAGASYPAVFRGRTPLPLEGRSLLPVLRNQSRPCHEMLCWRVPLNRAIRAGNWKLVESPGSNAWELYDLAADGTETKNLAAKHPGVVKDLAAKWQQWADRCGAKP